MAKFPEKNPAEAENRGFCGVLPVHIFYQFSIEDLDNRITACHIFGAYFFVASKARK